MNTKYIGAFTKNTILKLPNPQLGDTVIASDTKEVYKYTENGWEIGEIEETGLNVNLYDLNKSIVSQLPDLSDEAIKEKIILINDFYENSNNKFFMLYGKEISYFTVFAPASYSPYKEDLENADLGNMVVDTFNCAIKAIDLTSTGDAIEIWTSPDEDTVTCLYLFPYDSGIVGYGV